MATQSTSVGIFLAGLHEQFQGLNQQLDNHVFKCDNVKINCK